MSDGIILKLFLHWRTQWRNMRISVCTVHRDENVFVGFKKVLSLMLWSSLRGSGVNAEQVTCQSDTSLCQNSYSTVGFIEAESITDKTHTLPCPSLGVIPADRLGAETCTATDTFFWLLVSLFQKCCQNLRIKFIHRTWSRSCRRTIWD